MNGKTHKMRRRLSIVALVASIAAVAIPAASAGGKYLGPGSNTVQKRGPYGMYWVPMHRVLGPGLDTVEKRGPYGAYWVRKLPRQSGTEQLTQQEKQYVQGITALTSAQQAAAFGRSVVQQSIQDAAREHGASGFGNTSSLDWKPIFVDYSHLPAQDRP